MNKTADRTVALDKGRVDVYTKNGVTLYACLLYTSRDIEACLVHRFGDSLRIL